MDPMTIAAIGQLALGGAGMFMRDDPNENFRDRLRATGEVLGPEALGRDAQKFFQQWHNSPAFSSMMRNILAGSNASSNMLNRTLGASGIGKSGVGLTARALSGSAASFRTGDLMATAWQNAMSQALQAAQARVGATGMINQPRFTGFDQMAGIQDALSRYMLSLWQSRNQGSPNPNDPRFIGPQAPR